MRALSLLLLLAACDEPDVDDFTPSELPAEDSDGPAADTDAPTPEPTPAPTPEPTPEPEPEPEPEVVRFVAMGDGGEGNPEQYAVGRAVGTICDQRGCDFVLYLGDNFYDDGVDSVHDDQFQTKFELPYADLDLPFWVTLGNHDFGEIPIQFNRTDHQVEYTLYSDKWTMPDHFYAFDEGHATFLSLDTNMIMLGLDWTQNQRGWVRGVLADSAASTWRIAYGHHPYRSNGQHGNAGNYEGAWYDITGIVRGDNVKDFFDDELCGEIDLYLCGHDHNMQWLEPACGMELIVTGAASKTSDLVGRDRNGTYWDDDTTPGFAWIELRGREMTVAFYDMNATLLHTGSMTK